MGSPASKTSILIAACLAAVGLALAVLGPGTPRDAAEIATGVQRQEGSAPPAGDEATPPNATPDPEAVAEPSDGSGSTSSPDGGSTPAEPFDLHSGPYTPEALDSLPLEELREIRRAIRRVQRELVAGFEETLSESAPYVTDEDFHAAGLDHAGDLYLPVITQSGTRHYPVSPGEHPELHMWRERARAVQAAPAYRAWIEDRRREALRTLEQNPLITNCEVVTSPSDDKWIVFATVRGVRRRVAQQDDQTGY